MAKPTKAPIVDATTLAFAAAAAILSLVTLWLRDAAALERIVVRAGESLLTVLPPIIGGMLVAGLAQVLVSKDAVSRWLGQESGMRGLTIAIAAGVLTPGGPFGSFALVYALGKVGADIGVLVAYLTAWTTLSLNRVVVWEIPFLGVEFALLRVTLSLPIAIIAGLIARRLAKLLGWTSTREIVK